MVKWKLFFTDQACKDSKKLERSGLKEKAEKLLKVLESNPYQKPPPFEKLRGDLAGCCSRRINIQHRLVYQIYDKSKSIKILRLWSHYE
ncbi:MAG: Txe/YoeB family addiction module toxin [Deltaproteobacteria bacterium]|nr:Txe/YoeB family addiction module toxin [Deltaproteobacteria bacterium]